MGSIKKLRFIHNFYGYDTKGYASAFSCTNFRLSDCNFMGSCRYEKVNISTYFDFILIDPIQFIAKRSTFRGSFSESYARHMLRNI